MSKVKVNYHSKTLTKTLTGEIDASIARSLASGQYNTVVNTFWKSTKHKVNLLTKVEKQIEDECAGLSSRKHPSILSNATPENIIELTNSKVVDELMLRETTLYQTMQAACSNKEDKKPEKKVHAVSVASSILLRCRTGQPYLQWPIASPFCCGMQELKKWYLPARQLSDNFQSCEFRYTMFL